MITLEQVTDAIAEGIDRAHDMDATHQDYAESAARLVMELIAAEVATDYSDPPRDIWAVQHDVLGAIRIGEWADTIRHIGGEHYIRAAEVKALIEAVSAEIEARRKFLSTAPDRGAKNGLNGVRKTALEDAQLRTIVAIREIKASQ